MNILIIVNHNFDGSPSCAFVHDQALAFQALGHDVRVVATVPYCKPAARSLRKVKHAVIDGLKVYYPRHLSFSKYGKYGLNSFFGKRALRKVYLQIAGEFQPDILHAHYIGFAGDIATRLKKELCIPVVITTHGSDTIMEIQHGCGDKISKICRQADAIVSVSSKMARELNALDSSLNAHVIANGHNVSYITPQTRIKNSIVSVGALIKQKRFGITLKAFAAYVQVHTDARLTIIGHGEDEQALKELARTLGVCQRVDFLGQVSNETVFKYMAQSEYFILPSIDEGFGIVYIEAMSCGCVVIGTKGGGIADVIVPGENGILVEPDNPKEIVAALEKCTADTAFTEHLRAKAKVTAEKLTWTRNAQKNVEVFQSVLTRISTI